MKPTVLCIIGNGFDLHHKISTNYSDFSDHLKEHNSRVYDDINRYLPVNEWWSNLEESFADVDTDDLIDYAMTWLVSYGADDWRDSGHHDFQYELGNLISRLSRELRDEFIQWLKEVEIPDRNSLSVPPLKLPKNSLYLNFNYTSTLQKVYCIPSTLIWHIHGSIDNDYSIVLGHGWNPAEIPNPNDDIDPEKSDPRINEGYEMLNNYFRDTFKPTEKIISDNENKFKTLSHVNKVYVLGHSMSYVDIAYFEKIVASIHKDASWFVSYYGQNERESLASKLEVLNVQQYTLCNLSQLFDAF